MKKRSNPHVAVKTLIGVGGLAIAGAVGYGVYESYKRKQVNPCGEKYKFMAVTPSGYNFENPWGAGWPTTSDYQEWYELARDLTVRANDRFSALGDLDPKPYKRWNALIPLQNRMFSGYDSLPSPFSFTLDYEAHIHTAQKTISDALCLMERSDEGITALGGEIPDTPTVVPEADTSKFPGWTIAAIGAGAVATGLIVYAVSEIGEGGGGGNGRPRPSRPSRPISRSESE